MKYRIFLFFNICVLISGLATADSELTGKIVNDEKICSLFYENDRYIWFPKDVFVRSHFKSKESTFDANNDSKEDYLKLKENLTSYQSNMMYFAYDSPTNASKNEYKYIFPQSWMECRNDNLECSLDRKIKEGVLNIGLVPGKEKPVYYRSRYTNVFPFMREGNTYYKITTESMNKDVVTIIKPLPNDGKYEVICAFVTGKKL